MESLMAKTNSLTNRQIFFLMTQTQIGFGILSLPNTLQATSKGDGWISVLMAGVMIQLVLIMLWLLLKRFPRLTYPEITQFVLGKQVGKFVNLIIYIYFIWAATFVLLQFTSIIEEHLLISTPYWVIGLLIILTCTYAAISDIRIIARFFGVISIVFLFLFGISFFSFLLPMELHHILPFGSSGLKNITLGSRDSMLTLLGFEVILFLYPLAEKKGTDFLKVISWANVFVTGLTAYFVLLCILIFSEAFLEEIKYPVIYFLRPLHFQMIDRIDLLFISIWIVPLAASIIIFIYLASKSLRLFTDNQMKRVLMNSLAVFLLFIAAPKDPESKQLYTTWIEYMSYLVLVAIPLLLLLCSRFLHKQIKEDSH